MALIGWLNGLGWGRTERSRWARCLSTSKSDYASRDVKPALKRLWFLCSQHALLAHGHGDDGAAVSCRADPACKAPKYSVRHISCPISLRHRAFAFQYYCGLLALRRFQSDGHQR
ncbi:hypothetical protein KCP74_03305 [Salmonella enterica subsp. enterica]|nr:hypothetical protein KCP74_03305 [Salmonella enterica subsp. enterica]